MRGLLKGAGIAVLALALAAGSARAQVKFGVGGGVSIPSGDALSGVNTGFHGMAQLRFKPPLFPIGFQFDGAYHRFSLDEFQGVSVNDVNLRFINVTANVVWEFPSAPATPVRPYLIGGLGYYSSKPSGDGLGGVEFDSQNDAGLNVGAGFDLGKNLFGEVRFHKVFADGDDPTFIPITVGFRF